MLPTWKSLTSLGASPRTSCPRFSGVAFGSPRSAPDGENQGGAVMISRITGRESYSVSVIMVPSPASGRGLG
jgi:hypothetical protein